MDMKLTVEQLRGYVREILREGIIVEEMNFEGRAPSEGDTVLITFENGTSVEIGWGGVIEGRDIPEIDADDRSSMRDTFAATGSSSLFFWPPTLWKIVSSLGALRGGGARGGWGDAAFEKLLGMSYIVNSHPEERAPMLSKGVLIGARRRLKYVPVSDIVSAEVVTPEDV